MFTHVRVPEDGKKIEVRNGRLVVPDHPIIGYIVGDGTGRDIMPAAMKVWDAAVQKVYGGQRKIAWVRLYAGEDAEELYGERLPEETLRAIREFVVAIKGPLTTPVGYGWRSINVQLRQKLTSTPASGRSNGIRGSHPPSKNPIRSTWWCSGRTRRMSTPGSSGKQARRRPSGWRPI